MCDCATVSSEGTSADTHSAPLPSRLDTQDTVSQLVFRGSPMCFLVSQESPSATP